MGLKGVSRRIEKEEENKEKEKKEKEKQLERAVEEKSERVHDHRRVGKTPVVIMKSDVWVQVGRIGLAEPLRYLFGDRHIGSTAIDSPRQVTSSRYLSHWSSGGVSTVAEEIAESWEAD